MLQRAGAAAEAPLVVPVGSFSNISQDAEHCNGYRVDLWTVRDSVLLGVFTACAGLTGDLHRGHVNMGRLDPQTHTIKFESDLSLGMDYAKGGNETPSRDHYVFSGTLGEGKLEGSMAHYDLVHPKREPKSQHVLLNQLKVKFDAYITERDWELVHGKATDPAPQSVESR